MKVYKVALPFNFFFLVILMGISFTFLFFGCGCENKKIRESQSQTHDQLSSRRVQVLSDNWRFQLDLRDIGEKEKWYEKNNIDWGIVTVPLAWNCYSEALFQYEGIGWYTITFTPDNPINEKRTDICFGRVMYYSKVWLNGEFIGENIGGYLPFSFNVTKYLKAGKENRLVVRVDNRPRINWLPAAEQIEWIQYGGILEPVKLSTTSQIYIKDLSVKTTPDHNSARVNCIVKVQNETEVKSDLELKIEISRNSVISDKGIKISCNPGEITTFNLGFNIEKPSLWSPDTPDLYTAIATLTQNGSKIDDISSRFGIREISVKGPSIRLNGENLLIKGSHRYDAYDHLGPTPPEKLLREELSLMKSVGINTIRVHYPASPDLLDLLDEYGLMIMEEIPLNWWGQTNWKGIIPIGGKAEQSLDILEQAKSTLTGMIERDKNHPCIIIWSMANECVTDNQTGITAMRELLKLTKSLDSTRLATFVAGSDPTKHSGFDQADIVCFNKYVACDHISQIDSVVYQPLARELSEYRSFFGDKPIIMSEFGRQGIKGIHGDVFASEEFQAAYIESMWKALRGNPSISGGIIWTWADYIHETHFALTAPYAPYGVVTGDRKPKKSLESLARMYGGSVPAK